MRKLISSLAFAAVLGVAVTPVFAQGTEQPDRPQGDKPERLRPDKPEGDRPQRPDGGEIMRHLDPDGNGAVSREEAHQFAREALRRMRERMQNDRPQRPDGDRPQRPDGDRPQTDRPQRPDGDRPQTDRPQHPDGDRPQTDRPQRPDGDRPQRPDGDRPQRPDGDRPHPVERMFNAADQNEDGMLTDTEIRQFARMFREFMSRLHQQHQDGQRPQGGTDQLQ